jgi:hypothetical protein
MRFAIALAAATWMFAVSAHAQRTVPIERDAIISDTQEMPRARLLGLVNPAVAMIRAHGWRCDSISALRPLMLARGYAVTCNQFAYSYEIRDRGGNWVVELK